MMKTLIVSEWLLFYANVAIFQLYHRENMIIVNEHAKQYATDAVK